MPPSILQGNALFNGVDPAALSDLLSRAVERRLGARQVVFRKGDPGDSLYVVERGQVIILHDVVGEPVERVRDIGPGDLFGEMEVLEGSSRHFSARTVEPTHLYRIPAATLRGFLVSYPQIEMRLRTLSIQRRTSRLRAVLGPSTRKEPRIRVDRSVTLSLPEGSRVGARVEDMSGGGVCLSGAPPAWSPAQPVRFSLGLPGRPELLAVQGTIRWRDGDLLGIAFGDESTAYRRRAEQVLRDLVALSV
jgi:CRP/FNR family cyclic AMP-dependent transcriptional regulator